VSHEVDGVCEFAFAGPLRDRLVDAVLRGEKTATCGLLIEWEVEGEPLPVVGARQAVIDSHEAVVGIIELTDVEVVRLGDVGLRFAVDEGEGFGSVAAWRSEHERFWTMEVFPTLPDRVVMQLTDDTPIVTQRFRLVRE
jgi:uncharacterized protein YhfF